MSSRKAVFASYLGVIILGMVIFIAGGRVDFWQAWLYLALAVFGTVMSHVLTPANSGLAAERANRAKEGERWDRRLLGLLFLVSICGFVVAGLDSGRFGWSGEQPFFIVIIGSALMVAGQALFALAKRENSFFASTVRIETTRTHEVCETGPYHFIRHPGYLGMILANLGFPMVMESYWSAIPVAAAVVLLVTRTYLEDRFLGHSLTGYREYSMRVRFRLIPGLF